MFVWLFWWMCHNSCGVQNLESWGLWCSGVSGFVMTVHFLFAGNWRDGALLMLLCPQLFIFQTFSLPFLSCLPLSLSGSLLVSFFFPFPFFFLLFLVICFSFMFCWANQCHGYVFTLLPVLWEKLLSILVNVGYWPPPTAGSWLSQHRCCVSQQISYMFLLTITECVWQLLLFRLFHRFALLILGCAPSSCCLLICCGIWHL